MHLIGSLIVALAFILGICTSLWWVWLIVGFFWPPAFIGAAVFGLLYMATVTNTPHIYRQPPPHNMDFGDKPDNKW